MRFTLTGIVLIMAAVLALAVGATWTYRQRRQPVGVDLVMVLFKSRDGQALRRAFEDGAVRSLDDLRGRGVSFLRCAPPSAWYPSVAAALFTADHPSECGLHRGHAWLSGAAETLAERLGECGFKTLAVTSTDGFLEDLGVLQGFHTSLHRTPTALPGAFAAFMKEGDGGKNRFVFMEADLDVRGGPGSLEAILAPLLKWMETHRFFRRGVLLVAAAPWNLPLPGKEAWNSHGGMPLILAGDPLRLGPGKCFLRRLDLCAVAERLEEIALNQGLNLRDARRTGMAAVTEDALDPDSFPLGEVNGPPPLFRRVVRFDDTSSWVEIVPGASPRLFDGKGAAIEAGSEEGRSLLLRYRAWLENRRMVEDRTEPGEAGPVLDRALARRLGKPWEDARFLGRRLHAVEHFRAARILEARGFRERAAVEYETAIRMDPAFRPGP